MTTANLPQSFPFQPVRMSVMRYHELVAAGASTEHDEVELLDGVVVEKRSKNPRHRLVTRKCDLVLSQRCPDGWHVQNQEPVTLQNSEPEPDVAIVRGQMEDYSQRHPLYNEVALVVEVSDTTLVTDRYKSELYALAGIPYYWLINLTDRQIEVMSDPQVAGSESRYARCQILSIGDVLPFVILGQTVAKIPVTDLLT
ncbi:MAG: Uma2 family endonuclease [Planctomycetaceae bacterium]|nr:Uma2 family endonuclease [Planctomycetaceae bacterium]